MKKNVFKKGVISTLLILLLIISGFSGLLIFKGVLDEGSVEAATIIVDCNGGGDYPTIQEAINTANFGDTIYVWVGEYNENIIVNKPVTLIGNGTVSTVINGTGNIDVVQITANWVNMTGFTIRSIGVAKAGISLLSVNNCNISDNNCLNNVNGFYISDSSNNIIINNICMNCNNGIVVDNSESNMIKNNTMVSCGLNIIGYKLSHWSTHDIENNTVNSKPVYYWKNINSGIIPSGVGQVILANCQNITLEHQNLSNGSISIQLGFSNYNTIKNNLCNLNNKFGIYLYKSQLNKVANNTCDSNQWGAIYLMISDFNTVINNTWSNNNDGINVFKSNSNTIINNTCNSNNYDGIWIAESHSNIIINNTCNSNNDDGIDIYESGSNTIINNTCSFNNDYGIVLQNTHSAIVMNNTMYSCGLHIIGYLLSQYDSHNIDTNNRVNGKPLYYWKNINNGKIPSGAGQVILVSCSNVIVENQDLSDGSTSIELFFSSNNSIKNNLCNQNNNNGIYLWRSHQNFIINNNFHLCYYHGILLSESHSNNVIDNTCNSNLNQGIYLKYSRSNTITNNTCNSNNVTGILPRNSKYNSIINNTCNSNIYYGIYLDKSDSNFIINNTCKSNNYDGIWVGESNSNTINNNTCNSNNYCGLDLEVSNSNTVFNNTCNSNIETGILLSESNSNTIIKNICLNNDYGIKLSHSRLNNIQNNNYSMNDFVGIKLDRAEINSINNNTCNLNTGVGIELIQSDWNLIENNTCNLTDVSIYFFESHFNTIKNNVGNFCDYYGIHLKDSTSNTVINNIYSFNTFYGIFLSHSSLNTITNNNISNNGKGIFLYLGSFNNVFFKNIILNNSNTGISIRTGCNQNRFFYNNIITNVKQAEEGTVGSNYWDNGNGEGNYWSDYLGVDNGAGGRVPGDGIGDTKIPHLGLDNYPFVNFSGWSYPAIPILIITSPVDSDGNYALFWNQTRGTSGYILEEDDNNAFDSPVIFYEGWIIKNMLLVFNVTDKHEGTYWYRLKAFNELYECDWSNIVNITVDYPPNIPQNLIVSVYPGGNVLNLSWDLNLLDIKEYELYFMNDTTSEWKYLDNITHSVNTYYHTNLSDGQTYYYKIRAKDWRDQYSSFSKSVNAIPADSVAPKPPTGLSVTKTTIDSITLVWEPNTDIDLEGYNIYRSTTTSPLDWGQPISTILKGNEKYINTGLEKFTKYYYVITAFDEVPNESNYSKVVIGKTLPGPRAPEINNSILDFEIIEDTIDNTSINLYYWFKDVNKDPLEFNCTGQKNINVTIDSINGTVILIPKPNWNGQETLIFYASDGTFNVSDNVTITVTPINDPPELVIILAPKEGQIFEYGKPINFTAHCDDPDLPYGDKLTINWSSNMSGELGKSETLTNLTLAVGNHLITLDVSDIVGETAIANVNITVLDSIKDTEPDKSEDNIILILVSMIAIIIIIIILFIFPGWVFPGWVKLNEKIKKKKEPTKEESTTQSDTSSPSSKKPKKSDIRLTIEKTKHATLKGQESENKSSTKKSVKSSTKKNNTKSNKSSKKAKSSDIEKR